MTGDRTFPPGFLWGAATAAYQIEGAVDVDGRGPSVWDVFAAVPGAVVGGASGATACDHYHRYREDVALVRDLGLAAYRFSTAWPRVMPDGRTANPAGLAFYDRLVDTLLEHGIAPVLTLYHWDLPQSLEERGGWLDRDIASWFTDYALTVHNRLGDRVRSWTTLNEPFCSAFLGYGTGEHAPGRRCHRDALRAAHHHLLAHGHAAMALRSSGVTDLAIALNFSPALADAPDHHDAVRRFDAVHNRFFLDPVLGLGYPPDLLDDIAHLDGLTPAVQDGDLAVIAEPVDWIGVNYYAPTRVASLPDPTEPSNCPLPGLRGMSVLPPRGPLTVTGWEQHPDSLTDLLVHLAERTGKPLVVAENGSAFPDVVDADGRVRDHQRVRYLAEHLRAVHAAIQAGADVRGYLAWSLLDNFEWASGYGPRFGVVHVDFDSQRRVVKDSGRFLAQVASRNAVPGLGDRFD
ncbi:GH1 family beta-glucosidase [Actinokineospora inagensis]|uniref:GH1 family beta-glucosidase n=1 Tax=Actinokineospora inagensis TaxID=103730 RepID=UPI0004265763|nr:GH1 family beta-glucosidase [Actinokineospora inagensis]